MLLNVRLDMNMNDDILERVLTVVCGGGGVHDEGRGCLVMGGILVSVQCSQSSCSDSLRMVFLAIPVAEDPR